MLRPIKNTMLDEEMDNQDALEPESEQDTTPEPEFDDVSEKLSKAEEVAKNQKIRAEKAEAELKKLKAETAKQEPKKEEKSNEPDYTERMDKLTLKSEGITNPDDIKTVLNEAKRLKLPIEEVVSMEHIQAKLKTAKAQREAEDGMPSGKGKTSGSNKTTVDYWVDKKKADGTFDTPDDLELAQKVIDARLKQHAKQNMFADDLY